MSLARDTTDEIQAQYISSFSQDAVSSIFGPTSDTATQKLTKSERKALYRPIFLEPHESRRKVLKDVFIQEKDETLKNELITSILFFICETDENPYYSILQLHKICPDYATNKANSLAGITIQCFKKWLSKQENRDEIFERCVTDDIKKEAFQVATAKSTIHLKLFVELFHLDDSKLLPFIKDEIDHMVERQMFKEAMEVVAQYQLHDHYGLEAFVIPCVLQDKAPLVHKYLEDRKHLQRQYMAFLDSFVGLSEEEVIKRLKPYKDKKIMTLQYGRFSGKTIEKMICRLTINDQSLQPEDAFPRFFRNRAEGNLRYKVQSRFTAHELSDEAYFGYISDALKRADDKMRRYFINYLMFTRNKEDAVRWVLYFNMSDDMLPSDLVDYMRNNPIAVKEAAKNLKKYELYHEDTYIELLPNYPIIMVDTWINLLKVIEEIGSESVIGIDSEWKPQYLATGENIALLQVAMSHAVYLIDFCILEEKLTLEQWKIFIKALLCGEAVKLGFDFINDLRALFAGPITYELKDLEKDINNVICLKRMIENLLFIDDKFINLTKEKDMEIDDFTRNECGVGVHFKLSDLSERISGRALDKSEQCSNWAQRPLRTSQKMYAAMDAYIVIDIYNRIKEKAKVKNLDFRSVLVDSFVNAPRKEKDKQKKERVKLDDMAWYEIVEKLNDTVIADKNPKKPKEVKCLVDSMLLGLGRHLRRCGVDVLIPENRGDLIKKARSNPTRYIISSGKAYELLRQQFPSQTIGIPNASKMAPLDQLKFVLTKFSVSVSQRDIFSRCMECNASSFVRAPGPVLQALYESAVICQNEFHDQPFDLKGWVERLSKIDPKDHGGVGCVLEVHPEYPDWITARCDGGYIHITKNIIVHDDFDDGVDVLINKVPTQVISRPGQFYYICGDCGKVYWDGTHATNYSKVANDVITSTITTGFE